MGLRRPLSCSPTKVSNLPVKTAFYALLALSLSFGSASAQRLLRHSATPQALLAGARGYFHTTTRATAGRSAAATVLRPGQKVAYSYDQNTGYWVDPHRVSFSYDTRGLTTQETAADSASDTLLNRTLTVYNTAQQPLSSTHQYYQSPGGWTDDDRQVLSYDAQQNLVLDEHQYATAAGTWQTDAGTRYLNGYNAARQLIEETVQVFRHATQTYADSVRYQYTVAANGEWTSRLGQELDGQGGWHDAERLHNAVWHNFAQDEIATVELQVPGVLQQWQTVARQTGTYTPTRQELLAEELRNGTWTNLQRYFITFDFAGNPEDIGIDAWQGGAWQVVVALNYQYTYNPDATIHSRITRFDFGGSGLELSLRENFSDYQPTTLATHPETRLAAPLQPDPHPSPDGRFTIWLPAVLPAAQVSVTDALGREVARDAWQGSARSSFTLDLSAQPAGFYTVRVQTPTGYAVQKISIR